MTGPPSATGPTPSESLAAADPFDLPDWVALAQVTWTAESGLGVGHRVRGSLADATGQRLDCDLLAVDDAYPVPVTDEGSRTAAHQAWHHGQVHLAQSQGRLVLAVPGRVVRLELVLEALRRLTFAVGGRPDRLAVLLRLGGAGS